MEPFATKRALLDWGAVILTALLIARVVAEEARRLLNALLH